MKSNEEDNMKKLLAIALTLILLLPFTQIPIALAEEFPEGKTFKELFPDRLLQASIWAELHPENPHYDDNEHGKTEVSLDDLSKVKSLFYHFSPINSFEGIQYLKELNDIQVSEYDAITELPEELFSLKKLISITLSGENMTSQLERLEELENLESITIRNTKAVELPLNFYTIKSLKVLVLEDNNITKLDEKIIELSKLETLRLVGIEDIPKNIGNLENLTSVYIPLANKNAISILLENGFEEENGQIKGMYSRKK